MNGITIIRFIDGSKRYKIEGDLWQYDYGQKLIIEGLDLPGTYEVHFSNKEIYGSTKTQIGTADGVMIPDEYLISGEPLFVFIFLHDGTDDGETEYKAKIYVKRRPEPSDVDPTPQEQSAITEALAAFNKATDDIRNMDVESETLEPGSEATASWDGEKLTIRIPRGDVGPQGSTITSIALNADYTLTITASDGRTFTTPPIRGEKGEPGDDYILTPSDKAEIAELIDIIDDTAVTGDTDKTWSADKISHELESAGSVKDVTVNGESIVDSESGVAEIPTASSVKYGLVKPGAGLRINGGDLVTEKALNSQIKDGTTECSPIVPYNQHMATFYGLAKAAGDATQSRSANAVGTYTDAAKTAIQSMLGVDKAITDAISGITSFEFQIVQELPATGDKGIMYLVAHTHDEKDIYDEYIWVTDKYERLGTLDVDLSGYATTQYVNDELNKKVDDVQVNGTSVVTDGVATIPMASGNDFGVVKVSSSYGLQIYGSGANRNIGVIKASDASIKSASTVYSSITPDRQHQSTFYGLAKASGDTTQSQSSNAVGTYTEEAKVAIRNMIDATGESASVTVTGTDPVIQASRNTRYICGEILSLDFTPCASGICEVIFTSGSSVTVLTLPETIKMPEWFEVETNHTYEISVVDGVYGAVMVW